MTYPAVEFVGASGQGDTISLTLHNLTPRVTQFLGDGMIETAYDVLNLSNFYCPVATGFLVSSGSVDAPEVSPGDITVTIGYSAGYAMFVHERLDLHHKPPTQAKFLERAFNETVADLGTRLANRFDGTMLASYPGSPANAQHAEVSGDLKGAYGPKSSAEVARAIKSARPMTTADINAAIAAIGKGGSPPRTWHRA